MRGPFTRLLETLAMLPRVFGGHALDRPVQSTLSHPYRAPGTLRRSRRAPWTLPLPPSPLISRSLNPSVCCIFRGLALVPVIFRTPALPGSQPFLSLALPCSQLPGALALALDWPIPSLLRAVNTSVPSTLPCPRCAPWTPPYPGLFRALLLYEATPSTHRCRKLFRGRQLLRSPNTSASFTLPCRQLVRAAVGPSIQLFRALPFPPLDSSAPN